MYNLRNLILSPHLTEVIGGAHQTPYIYKYFRAPPHLSETIAVDDTKPDLWKHNSDVQGE